MDPDSPLVSRLERTFWTVWYYISGAVHRLLRPEPETVSDKANLLKDSAIDSELAQGHHEDEVHDGEVQGQQTLSAASPSSSCRPAVAWDLCTSEIDGVPDEKHEEDTADVKDSKTDEDTREEEMIQTGNGESRLPVAKTTKAEENDGVSQKSYKQAETLKYDKNDESMVTTFSGEMAAAEETERKETPDLQDLEDILNKDQDQKEHVLDLVTDDTEIRLGMITGLCPKKEVTAHKEEAYWQRKSTEAEITKNVFLLDSRNENRSNESTLKVDSEEFMDGESQMASNTRVQAVSESEPMVAQTAPGTRNDKSNNVDEESPEEEREQKAVVVNEKVNKTEGHKDEIQTVPEDSKEEVNASTLNEMLLNAESELHTGKRCEDVAKDRTTDMGDGETESCGAATDGNYVMKLCNIPADDCLFDEKQVQEESTESNVDRVTSARVKPEEDTGQEENCESGDVHECVMSVLAQGPEPLTFKAFQGEVPEYISEPEPDEKTSQRGLEIRGSEEDRGTPLLEELENHQNNDGNTEADQLLMRECAEKRQENKEESESYLDLVGRKLQQETEELGFETFIQEAELVSIEQNRELQVSSVEMGIDDLEKEFHPDFSLASEKDLQDRGEDLLVEMDEDLCEPAQKEFMKTKNVNAEETVTLPGAGEQVTKTSPQDPLDAGSLGQNINTIQSREENISATNFLEQSVVTELQFVTETEKQHTETDLEKASKNVDEVVGSELESAKHPETEVSNEKQTTKEEEQLLESNSRESESVSDSEMSLSIAESGFSDQSLSDWGTKNSDSHVPSSSSTGSTPDMFGSESESASFPKSSPQLCDSECQDRLMMGTAEEGRLNLKDDEYVSGFSLDSAGDKNPNQKSEVTKDDTEKEPESQGEIKAEEEDLLAKTGLKSTEEADLESLIKESNLFRVQNNKIEAEEHVITLSESQDRSELTESACTRHSSDARSEEGIFSVDSSLHNNTSKDSLGLPHILDHQRAEVEDQLTAKSQNQTPADDASALDFTAQRSRIAVKNPHVRPPKDPRSLILMPSLDPTPDPHLTAKLPSGGLGIGIKLPGLGAGFPALRKTQQTERKETGLESDQQESETRSEGTSDAPKQDETQNTRKWMPPRHPGFGNPLMSELKSKLKKTTKD